MHTSGKTDEPMIMSEWKRFGVKKNRGKYLVSAVAVAASFAVVAPVVVIAALTDMPVVAGSVDALMGQFTPTNGDSRLMAAYSKLSADDRNAFRFTPAMHGNTDIAQAMTVVVRSTPDVPQTAQVSTLQAVASSLQPGVPAAAPIAIAPMRYNLGSAIGFDRFALPATPKTKRLDIAALPDVKAPVTATAKPKKSRFGGDMKLGRDVLPGSDPRLLNPEETYSVDVSGRYKVSRNLDVTAGVRLRQENDRLQPLTDARQDSQAVYVGTRVKF